MRRRLWESAKHQLSEELEAHLQLAIADRVANGQEPFEARAAALRELGNVPQIRDVTREQWGWTWLEKPLQDLRYAVRQLRRSPGFTITALLTLAFGIGANLGVFQLLYAVVLADLPVPRPAEVVRVQAARSPFDQSWTISYPAYQRLRQATPDVPLMATSFAEDATFTLPNRAPVQVACEPVSDNYFSGLGAAAAAGRLFVEADERIGQDEWPAVLRFDFARNTFGSAAAAVGQHFILNKKQFRVIGVAHRRFFGDVTGSAPDVWFPLVLQTTGAFVIPWDSLGSGHDVSLDKPWYNQPTIFWLFLKARIKPEQRGTVLKHWDQVFRGDRELMTEATTDPAAKAEQLQVKMTLAPMSQNGMRTRFVSPLTLLMALSASIFLVGCLNLANLQLARLDRRLNEFAIRMALGASRRRLLGQIVVEDALLVGLGSVCALVVGRVASEVLVLWASNRKSLFIFDLHLNLPITLLGVSLMLLSLTSFSVVPALLFLRSSVAQTAGSRARVAGNVETARQRLSSNALLSAQVGLSLLLSSMSACLAATLVHWETIDVGMDREHVLTVRPEFHEPRYTDRPELLPSLYSRIQNRLESLPGIRSAAVAMCGSIHCGWITALYVHGRNNLTDGQVHGQEDHVSSGYFSTMGIPLLRGRDFSPSDTTTTQAVAIISRAYSRQLFGEGDPIGQWVGYGPAPEDHKFIVVGEVADARVNGAQREKPAVVYMDINQHPAPVNSIRVRTLGNPAALLESVRHALAEIEPALTVDEIVPLATELSGDLGTEKLLARLAGVYAGLTLLLVGIGFYGVMSSRTSRRRKEFGIRLALGATRSHIQALTLRQTGHILVVGVLAGIVLSILTVRLAGHLLYGSVDANASAIVLAALVLTMAGLIATLIPARRAAYVDPIQTLREE